jgi:GT2 family glycosyltransferase
MAVARPPSVELLVVIVNYRTPALTCQCLGTLAPEMEALPATRVLVVDNHSADGSLGTIQHAIMTRGWGRWCQIIETPCNLGFAGGNNFAIRQGPEANHVLLLNSDTRVHAGCLPYCLRIMHTQPDIGLLSCRLVQPDGQTQTQARRFPTPLRETLSAFGLPWRWPRAFGWASQQDPTWDRQRETRDVDWLGGAFVMIRGATLKQIGLLDESFFFYGEDIELSHRAARHGWRRHYDPAVAITHLGGGSSDGQNPIHCKPAYWQARYQVQRRCYGRWAATLLRSADLMSWALRLIKWRCTDAPRSGRYQQAKAICRMLTRARLGQVTS